MTDRPRRRRDKDASTRFMRVDQLFGGKTVEVPAATMLARAAASEARRPTAEGDAEAPTVQMPVTSAKALPATTVLPRSGAPRQPQAEHQPDKPAGGVSRVRPAAKRIALAVVALAVSGALIHAVAQRSGRGPTTTTPVVAAQTRSSSAPPLSAAVAGDARAAKAQRTTAPNDATRASLPSMAADQLAAGDHAAALGSYRELARVWPEERVYSLVAQVLERRLNARCAKEGNPGGPACAD